MLQSVAFAVLLCVTRLAAAEVWDCSDSARGRFIANFDPRSGWLLCAGQPLPYTATPPAGDCVFIAPPSGGCSVRSAQPSMPYLLRVGMSAAEVEATLGSPFSKDSGGPSARWTYRTLPSPDVVLVFDGGVLRSWSQQNTLHGPAVSRF